MLESLTISRQLPNLKSMQYEQLREKGIERIQELAGKLWTDYNSHDPGITILEALSYALTDIGYRISFDMQDLLAQNPNDPNAKDIQNFYTACEILPNCPVTLNDFRKLLIDCEIIEEIQVSKGVNKICRSGIKNAWIECAPQAEKQIYVDRKKSELSLDPIAGIQEQEAYYVKTMYDVLLEFNKNDCYGDLNENTLTADYKILISDLPSVSPNHELFGVTFEVTVEFPRWDEANIDWEDLSDINNHIKDGSCSILDLRDALKLNCDYDKISKQFILKEETIGTIPDLAAFQQSLNNKILVNPSTTLAKKYKEKVGTILKVIAATKDKLHENRPLCEDFFRFHALRVEEIILCSDIELAADADVEAVEAAILHAIEQFLSPSVFFYTLEEMLDKCRRLPNYPIIALNAAKRIITIANRPKEDLNPDDLITIEGLSDLDGFYTVRCIQPNRENSAYTDIEVDEVFEAVAPNEDALVYFGLINESACPTVDQIFEGPKLKHGFIDNEELIKAERRKHIRVSDLIRIIMDVDGVIAVKNIQIANDPQDNEDKKIKSRAVKWCMELAFEKNYVPRLSLERAQLTFYKGLLPFQANKKEVRLLIDDLEATDRPQKIYYPEMDIPVPRGEYMDLENYTSIQEEFPAVYGVGLEGIPGLSALSSDEQKLRKAKAKQLKGFLLFFDQLFANTTSQLHHIKDLFSMNGEKDSSGNYQIDHTYFTQSLINIVPDAAPLYVNAGGHAVALQAMAEDITLFERRRNKFLDHLLGRFAETFSDYALLAYRVHGAATPSELLADKLNFLACYPALSSRRGKGINYKHPCKVWHVDNVSGLEKRASLLVGIAPKTANDLIFSSNFQIDIANDNQLQIYDNTSNLILEGVKTYDTAAAAKLDMELAILNGVCKENYQILDPDGDGEFEIHFLCGEEKLAISTSKNYTSDAAGGDADLAIDEMIQLFNDEFYSNPESNRKNLACPLFNYFNILGITKNGEEFTVDYEFHDSTDFSGTPSFKGPYKVELKDIDNVAAFKEQYLKKALWEIIFHASDRQHYIFDAAASPDAFQLQNARCEQIGESINNLATEQTILDLIVFVQAKFFQKEGMHIIENTILRPRICDPITGIEDPLFPIYLDQDCESCKITDPYSCIVSVILPYWPGRFRNMALRKFIERTLRQEAPAHVLLNICWVSCEHIESIEEKYKSWLVEISKVKPNEQKQSQALKDLIEILFEARTVYPVGTLHDCENDETLENAIILNQSMLGSF